MAWLERNLSLREDPSGLLEGCRTVISLAYPYPASKPCTPDGLTAARYSEPRQPDYHGRLKGLARELARGIEGACPGTRTRVCVDSAPLMERSLAHAAGIGFIGKNNMLIVPGIGSYVFLAEILVTEDLAFDAPAPMESGCGSCTLCVDACPTGALERPFYVDASKCLSYLTIEYGGAVGRETGKGMGDCFLGCDVCQEVCPFNGERRAGDLSLPSTDEIMNMGKDAFDARFGKTAMGRAGLVKIKRNIQAIRAADAHGKDL